MRRVRFSVVIQNKKTKTSCTYVLYNFSIFCIQIASFTGFLMARFGVPAKADSIKPPLLQTLLGKVAKFVRLAKF